MVWFPYIVQTPLDSVSPSNGTVDRIKSLQCFPNFPSRDVYISRSQGSSYASFSRVGSQPWNISDIRFELFLCNDSIRISNAIFYPSSIKCLRTHTEAISNGFPLHPCVGVPQFVLLKLYICVRTLASSSLHTVVFKAEVVGRKYRRQGAESRLVEYTGLAER